MRETLHRFQKALLTRYLWLAGGVWRRLPALLRLSPVLLSYGTHLHSLVLKLADRRQNHSTFFLRNRAELELMRRLAGRVTHGSKLDVAVFACSKGAEVYSVAWTLKVSRPDLTINIHAIDISQDIVAFARKGFYSLENSTIQTTAADAVKLSANTYTDQTRHSPFKFMSESEKNEIFDRCGDYVQVKSWIKEGISWHSGDAGDPQFISVLGRQDMVIANRFLCHMAPAAAERILRNLANVLRPGGYLFVSGVDLDVRTRVALDMKWKAITELMEDVHEGDASIRDGWPLEYWTKEPFRAKRRDATIRYASAFQIY